MKDFSKEEAFGLRFHDKERAVQSPGGREHSKQRETDGEVPDSRMSLVFLRKRKKIKWL